jgi:biofilm PGA synthesis N-glycosyltransferase PgaC
MSDDPRKLLVVSPVFNEGRNLRRTGAALAAQQRPPDRWIIVDDGSTDDTLGVARALERELDYLTVLESDAAASSGPDKLALAREARAFNLGLRAADWRSYDFVGKLDGDVELPPSWYRCLLERFEQCPELGVAGGLLNEEGSRGWAPIPIPSYHVHGAVKLFRRDCLEAIGGIPERLAWDTIDETYARMAGYRTHSFSDLIARHHRPWGSADGRLRGRARHGECAWMLHYGPLWIALRSFKVATVPPVGLSGLAFFYGYARAAARGVPRVKDVRFRRFVRGELRARLTGALHRPAPGAGVSAPELRS